MGDIGRSIPSEKDLATILEVAKARARRCGANNDESDEVAQSTAVRLWEKWDEENVRRARERSHARWIGYIRQTARNLHLDRIREHQRRLARQRRSFEQQWSGQRPTTKSLVVTCPCPVDAYLARAAIAQEIVRLPPDQAMIAAMCFLDGKTVAEIAKIRGVQPQSIRKHLRAARTTLAERLTDDQ